MKVAKHPTLNILVREDGAVLLPPCSLHKKQDWTFGRVNKQGYMEIKFMYKNYRGLEERCGDDERIPSRAVEQGLEYDLLVNTARLNTIYIPSWNNQNGDFSEISTFLFFGVKKNVVKVLYINKVNSILWVQQSTSEDKQMKFTIEVTCPHCGETWEENAYLGSVDEIVNGGTIDTDCLSLKCGKVIDRAKFKVIGVWNFRTCETEYKTTEELVELFGKKDIE